LVDPLDVWGTGRTVQCDACGQRWRAVGEGVRPSVEPQPQADLPLEPFVAEEPSWAEPAEVEAEPQNDNAPDAGAPEVPGDDDRIAPADVAGRRDWHAAIPETPAETDLSLKREALLRKPPQRLTSSFGSQGSSAGRWLAVVFLVMIALAALVMFRDLVVEAFPGLAPIYASMGLLVHPAAAAHG
jgi:hypothetical protein